MDGGWGGGRCFSSLVLSATMSLRSCLRDLTSLSSHSLEAITPHFIPFPSTKSPIPPIPIPLSSFHLPPPLPNPLPSLSLFPLFLLITHAGPHRAHLPRQRPNLLLQRPRPLHRHGRANTPQKPAVLRRHVQQADLRGVERCAVYLCFVHRG